MAKALSADLRERIVSCIGEGMSRRAVAARFGVAASTAVRLQARYVSSGSVEPSRQGRPPGSGKLAPHRDFIIEQVASKPDITMPELAAALEEQRGVRADPSNLSKFLCRHGFSYKKNAAGIGARAR